MYKITSLWLFEIAGEIFTSTIAISHKPYNAYIHTAAFTKILYKKFEK